MFCSECGTQMPDTSNFCPKCGRAVTERNSIVNTENAANAKPQNLKSNFKQIGWLLVLPAVHLLWLVMWRHLIKVIIIAIEGFAVYDTYYLDVRRFISHSLWGAVLGGLVVVMNCCSKNFKWIYLLPYMIFCFYSLILNCYDLALYHQADYQSNSTKSEILERILILAYAFIQTFIVVIIISVIKKIFILLKAKSLGIARYYISAIIMTAVWWAVPLCLACLFFGYSYSISVSEFLSELFTSILSILILSPMLVSIIGAVIGCTIAYLIVNRRRKEKILNVNIIN